MATLRGLCPQSGPGTSRPQLEGHGGTDIPDHTQPAQTELGAVKYWPIGELLRDALLKIWQRVQADPIQGRSWGQVVTAWPTSLLEHLRKSVGVSFTDLGDRQYAEGLALRIVALGQLMMEKSVKIPMDYCQELINTYLPDAPTPSSQVMMADYIKLKQVQARRELWANLDLNQTSANVAGGAGTGAGHGCRSPLQRYESWVKDVNIHGEHALSADQSAEDAKMTWRDAKNFVYGWMQNEHPKSGADRSHACMEALDLMIQLAPIAEGDDDTRVSDLKYMFGLEALEGDASEGMRPMRAWYLKRVWGTALDSSVRVRHASSRLGGENIEILLQSKVPAEDITGNGQDERNWGMELGQPHGEPTQAGNAL